ncbi:hypothetical protein K7X08_016674 [Anisodus acutangulus]|uniref:Aminotransferase-like plant mobile domain-containing protein n=1 Tax=Anisodus acutangulus TaxID=402998 RepID=A0A9Q1R094_9SOLA|nr:hypothetical protein K7X08_016674 [Anisodus acutangulus]
MRRWCRFLLLVFLLHDRQHFILAVDGDLLLSRHLSPANYDIPITCDWFTGDRCPASLRTWPTKIANYSGWLEQVKSAKKDEWRRMGLYDAIALSGFDLPCNIGLVYAFLGYWSTTANTFVFPWGMMTPTLLDVTAILGLPILGAEAPVLGDIDVADLGIKVSKTSFGYGQFMAHNSRVSPLPVDDVEHHAFLLFGSSDILSAQDQGTQLIRCRRSQIAFGSPLHIGSSSSTHAPTHPQGPLSAAPKAKISLVEAAEDFHADAAVEEMAGDNPPTEVNSADDSEVLVEIVPEDVLLQYFGSVDIAPAPSSPVGIHRERVEESLAKAIPTSKVEFHALGASLFRLSKEANDSPVLAIAYNNMALALNDLFTLHKMNKDSHDEVVAALQHLGSLRQEKKHIQTSFNEGTHLDNKIRELDNQHVVWELDQKAGSERLDQLENEWTVWKNRLSQAMPTLPTNFSEVASEGTYSSVIDTPLSVDLVAQLSADILIDLQSKGIAASVTQEVLPIAEQ